MAENGQWSQGNADHRKSVENSEHPEGTGLPGGRFGFAIGEQFGGGIKTLASRGLLFWWRIPRATSSFEIAIQVHLASRVEERLRELAH